MAARQMKPRMGIVAAALSSLLVVFCFAGTALAAHNAVIVEINDHNNDDLTANELFTSPSTTASQAAVKNDSLKTNDIKLPSAHSAARQPDATDSKPLDVSVRIPGISNNGLARVKRQMYRKDI